MSVGPHQLQGRELTVRAVVRLDDLTSSQSPKGDGIPTPLQGGVSLNRTAMPCWAQRYKKRGL
jgi:hypothetical protein